MGNVKQMEIWSEYAPEEKTAWHAGSPFCSVPHKGRPSGHLSKYLTAGFGPSWTSKNAMNFQLQKKMENFE